MTPIFRAAELARRREELDQSEREEAQLMVELDTLLKESDSSLSLTTGQNEAAELHAEVDRLTHHRSILRHICEEFVAEGKKEGSEVGIAMSILLQHGGEMLLSDLKNEMKKEISGNPSLVLSVKSLTVNHI